MRVHLIEISMLFSMVLIGGGILGGCKSDRAEPMEAPLQRPATIGALARRALNALRAGDVSAYVALLATASEAERACPKRSARRGAEKMRRRWLGSIDGVRKGVANCRALIPWGDARELSRTGGDPGERLADCKIHVQRYSDLELRFEAHKVKYLVRLERPYMRGESIFGFAAGPRCSHDPDASGHRK